jgi:hypothetical protein
MVRTGIAANDETDASALLDRHRHTGEPLTEPECESIVRAGLATWEDFDQRGGGLWWHSPTWAEATE